MVDLRRNSVCRFSHVLKPAFHMRLGLVASSSRSRLSSGTLKLAGEFLSCLCTCMEEDFLVCLPLTNVIARA